MMLQANLSKILLLTLKYVRHDNGPNMMCHKKYRIFPIFKLSNICKVILLNGVFVSFKLGYQSLLSAKVIKHWYHLEQLVTAFILPIIAFFPQATFKEWWGQEV